ncbi:hypothetical protein BDY19DRAFT_933000 [Irpex rosettiformis]|uniref:Uncharacterized protein n=1 Tax=Irpex rosettiformis TaxID=378272 RepID=A0ACB8UA66_9APHY|nr:hypothetical protein BDY19DRAFT_933000 [Irpex rosettiformis]
MAVYYGSVYILLFTLACFIYRPSLSRVIYIHALFPQCDLVEPHEFRANNLSQAYQSKSAHIMQYYQLGAAFLDYNRLQLSRSLPCSAAVNSMRLSKQ